MSAGRRAVLSLLGPLLLTACETDSFSVVLSADVASGHEVDSGSISLVGSDQKDLVNIGDWGYCCGYIWRALQLRFDFVAEGSPKSARLVLHHMPLCPQGYGCTKEHVAVNGAEVKVCTLGDGFAGDGLGDFAIDISPQVAGSNATNQITLTSETVKLGVQGVQVILRY